MPIPAESSATHGDTAGCKRRSEAPTAGGRGIRAPEFARYVRAGQFGRSSARALAEPAIPTGSRRAAGAMAFHGSSGGVDAKGPAPPPGDRRRAHASVRSDRLRCC